STLAQCALLPALACIIASVTFYLLFPISAGDRSLKLFGVGALLLILGWLTRRGKSLTHRAKPQQVAGALGWALLIGLSTGIVLPLAQRAPDPSTHPLNSDVELNGTFALPQ